MNPITYIGCRVSPVELTALLNHEVVATAANDSDAYPTATRVAPPLAQVVPFPESH